MFTLPSNALIYRFTREIVLAPIELEQKLLEFSFKPCSSQQLSTIGWTKPLGDKTELFVHSSADWLLLTFKKEQKKLPPKVLAKEVKEKVDAIELEKGIKVGKREKEAITNDIVIKLLPRAFSDHETINLFINCSLGFIVVDASSSAKAETALSLLRKSLGSLPIVPACPYKAVSSTMTTWLSTLTTPPCLKFGYSAKLVSTLPKGPHATFNNQALDSDEIKACLAEQKVVSKLGLIFKDRLSFTLTDNTELKSLKYSDEIIAANHDISDDDEIQRMDADICLIEGELTDLLNELYSDDVLGGFDETKHDTVKNIDNALLNAEAIKIIAKTESEEPLLIDAILHISQERKSTVSRLQRKFRIGYNRACRLQELLSQVGAISSTLQRDIGVLVPSDITKESAEALVSKFYKKG